MRGRRSARMVWALAHWPIGPYWPHTVQGGDLVVVLFDHRQVDPRAHHRAGRGAHGYAVDPHRRDAGCQVEAGEDRVRLTGCERVAEALPSGGEIDSPFAIQSVGAVLLLNDRLQGPVGIGLRPEDQLVLLAAGHIDVVLAELDVVDVVSVNAGNVAEPDRVAADRPGRAIEGHAGVAG